MTVNNQSSKPFWIFFTFFCFLIVYFIFNIFSAKASIIDNIINLFTNNTFSQEIPSKSSLSDNDLLKPTLNSFVSVDSSSSNSKSNSDNSDDENQIDINEDGSLNVQSGPMRLSTEKEKPVNDTISLYEIKTGDTLDTVASLFGVSKNTIIWANNLKSKKLTPGGSLLIFPITGIQYTAKSSISISAIAKKYNADANEIVEYNGIALDSSLDKGDTVFIPDAEGQTQTEVVPKKNSKGKVVNKKANLPKYKVNSIAGYFMRPLNCVETQGLHGPYHSAVDFGCPIGTPVSAAADGTVIRATLGGYNGGYGSVIIISHPNGTQTIYAHLSQINVTVGQRVSQGQVMGATGNTGKSTGPHLHFETRGTANPFG
ncbi:MAG: peptidoglycan DD-metalloendopeptidase family protein [Candidatus Nomurabacteria bacterium]